MFIFNIIKFKNKRIKPIDWFKFVIQKKKWVLIYTNLNESRSYHFWTHHVDIFNQPFMCDYRKYNKTSKVKKKKTYIYISDKKNLHYYIWYIW